MALSLPLEGDGLISNLYYFLWAKDDFGNGPSLNLPPTILFELNQPVGWYFTSKRSGQIKKKAKANVSMAQIDQHFTKNKTTADIVAYFVAIPTCKSGGEASGTSMEYFDVDGLRDFLYRRDKTHSGILQKFMLPKGTCNTTIRAIWSPKICLLERQVNLRNLYDKRYTIYERGATFDGSDLHSRSEPVRGAMLPGEVQHLCEQIVSHVARVSYHKNRISRMVLHLKADAHDKLWLLWVSSLRLLDQTTSCHDAKPRPVNLVQDQQVARSPSMYKISSGVAGSNEASSPNAAARDAVVVTSTGFHPSIRNGVICVSCGEIADKQLLVNTNYRAILEHFDKLMNFLRLRVNETQQNAIEWPPDDKVIQAAGGVGFGTLKTVKTKSLSKQEVVIPPVVRFLHPNLSVEEFEKHRHDPIFLHRRIGVCEKCYLVYADYSSFALESNTLHANAPSILLPHRMIPELKRQLGPLNPMDEFVQPVSTSPMASPERGGGRKAMSIAKDQANTAAAIEWQIPCRQKKKQSQLGHKQKETTSNNHAPKRMLRSMSEISLPPPQLPQRIEFASEILQHEVHQEELVKRQEAFFAEMYRHPQQLETSHPLHHMLESEAKTKAANHQFHEIKACLSAMNLNEMSAKDREALLWTDVSLSSSDSQSSLLPELYERKNKQQQHKSPYLMVQRLPDSAPSRAMPTTSSPNKSQVHGQSQHHHANPCNSSWDPNAAAEDRERTSTPNQKHNKNKHLKKPKEQRQISMEHREFLHQALQQAQIELENTKLVKLREIVSSSDAVDLASSPAETTSLAPDLEETE